MNIHRFLKDWALLIAMLSGVLIYFIYRSVPLFDSTHAAVEQLVAFMQPTLIFLMLFVTFCKIKISDLRLSIWHFSLLAFQVLSFALFSLVIAMVPMSLGVKVILESFMICLVCPTATAATVITARLGGNATSLISYTMLINIAVALVCPFFLTLSHPVAGVSVISSFLLIMGKVFPLLLFPLVAAELLRFLLPLLHRRIVEKGRNVPFYLWVVALSLAIAMTTRAIVHSDVSLLVMFGVAITSFICCLLQFALGRIVGSRWGETVTGGQALGQKNTVFAIWFACTFLTPVTAIAGGFYSIWHNVVNTWQLYKYSHKRD